MSYALLDGNVLASDDAGAAAEIGTLAEELRFVPIKLGGFRKV